MTGTDRGGADERVTRALLAWSEQRTDAVEVLAALRDSRVLVPVVALPASEGGEPGEMAGVLLRGRDGRAALLGFTSLDSMRRWNPEARPQPTPVPDAARSARVERAQALVVDVAGPVQFVVEAEDLDGLAGGWELHRVAGADGARGWVRPAAGPTVRPERA